MQQSIFRAGEILDMAIQVEHHGISFYQACLQSPMGPKIKHVFDHLIEQEHNHIRIFRAMKKEVANEELPEDYPGEMQSYIDAFVDKQVFKSPTEAARKAASLNSATEAVDLAVDFEERSIRFYSAIQPHVRRSEREKLDNVIAEEHSHIRNLNELRQKLSA
jgi:rubrerythrin